MTRAGIASDRHQVDDADNEPYTQRFIRKDRQTHIHFAHACTHTHICEFSAFMLLRPSEEIKWAKDTAVEIRSSIVTYSHA